MNNQNVTLKKAMLEALEKSLNIVSQAVKIVGIERNTHYRWMREDPEYAKAVRALDDMVLDFAESNLCKQIKNGNATSTIYYLNHKGKSRGYNTDIVQKQESVEYDLSKLSAQELQKFTQLMRKVTPDE